MEDKNRSLVEKVKAIQEVGNTYKNAMDNNAKNTKELYDVLKKELETNENLSKDFRIIVEKEIEAYEKGLDNSTSEEERKIIYDKLDKLVEEEIKKYNEIMANNKELRESAMKIDEENRRINRETILYFGISVLATIGVVAFGKKGLEISKKYFKK